MPTVAAEEQAVHLPLTRSLRDGTNEDGEPVAIVDLLASHGNDPHDTAAAREHLARIRAALPWLTPLELRAVVGLALGYGYAELGDHKAIDNAYHRGRVKLRRAA